MKNKIITLILSLVVICLSANAQVAMQATIPSTAGGLPSGATTVNCVGTTAVYTYVKPTLNYKQASFQANFTRTGTSTTGSCRLQYSVDGINYITTGGTDSIHITNAASGAGDALLVITSGSTAFPNGGLPAPYYRLKCQTYNAADSMTVKTYFYGRQ